MPARCTIFCLDASSYATSEDFGDTRLQLQRGAAELLGQVQRFAPARGGFDGDKVAVVASSGGKASVVLPPTNMGPELVAATSNVCADGESNPVAALKLALMVGRRFSNVHIVAFLAGPSAVSAADAADLQQRLAASPATRLSLASFAPREELGAATCDALEALAGAELEGSSVKLTFLRPAAAAEDLERWQLLDEVMDQMEAVLAPALRRGIDSTSPRAVVPEQPPLAPGSSGAAVRLPSRVSCRGGSLDRYLHLSSSGMLRRWLPTYATIQQKLRTLEAAAGAGAAPRAGECFIQVQPVPRFRTLIKVGAGRMMPAPEPGSTCFAPAPERGTLRILQDLKQPHRLVVGWHPLVSPAEAAAAAAQSPPLDLFAAAHRAASAAAGGSTLERLRAHSGGEAESVALPPAPLVHDGVEYWECGGTLPPFAFAASLRPGGAVEVDRRPGGACVLHVPTVAEASAPPGTEPAEAPAAEKRWPFWLQATWDAASLPALLAAAMLEGSVEAAAQPRAHIRPQALAQPPLRRALSSAVAGALDSAAMCVAGIALWRTAAPVAAALGPVAAALLGGALLRAVRRRQRRRPPLRFLGAASLHATPPPADQLAACLLALAAAGPPAVDYSQLRRDVKMGAICVTPVTLGPLPRDVVARLVAKRAEVLASLGVENLDSVAAGGGASIMNGVEASPAVGSGGNTSGSGGTSDVPVLAQALSPPAKAAAPPGVEGIASAVRALLAPQPEAARRRQRGLLHGMLLQRVAELSQQVAAAGRISQMANTPPAAATSSTGLRLSVPAANGSATQDSDPVDESETQPAESYGTPVLLLPVQRHVVGEDGAAPTESSAQGGTDDGEASSDGQLTPGGCARSTQERSSLAMASGGAAAPSEPSNAR